MGDDNGRIGCQENDDSGKFASYPTQFGPTATGLYIDRQVFWNQKVLLLLNTTHSHYGDPSFMIHEKIKTAFFKVCSSPLDSIIQFWAPVKTSSGRLVLSTENQPFALLRLNTRLRKYRLSCLKYLYNVDDNKKLEDVKEKDTSMMIINGPAAAAFFNHLPEVVLDLKASECPLLHIALKYDLTCSLMLPVFDPNSSCIGVVECCMMRSTRLLSVFNELKYSLECVGLSIYNIYESPPSKGLTTDAIQQALHVICSSHDLPVAQVWIINRHHVSSSSNTPTKPLFLVKSAGYYVLSQDDRHLIPAYHFYNHSHILPLRIVEGGLVERTLQTGQPHFCKDFRKLKANGLLGLLSATTNCSSLVMCLRSTHPEEDNVDYVFEFLWPQRRNHIILLESMLLLTLKKCLPSFKFAYGAQLADELCVIDAENSTQIVIGSFSNLRGMKPDAHQEADDDEEEDDDDDDKDLIIVARYEEYVTLLLLSDSSTFANTKEKIGEDLGLDPAGTYSYEVSHDYGKTFITLTDDATFANSVLILRSTPATRIELRVRLISNKPLQ